MGEVGPDFWAVSDQIDATIRDTKAKLTRLGEGPSLAEAVSALVIDRNRLLAERDRLRAAMQATGPMAEVEALATTREVAEFLRLTENTVKTWRARAQGPPWFTVEGTVRYRWADVEAWLEANNGAKL